MDFLKDIIKNEGIEKLQVYCENNSNLDKICRDNIQELKKYNIKNKRKATNLKRYGVENTAQLESVKNKTKATNLERYGVEYTLQLESVKNKIKATNLKRYGVENIAQLESVENKRKATNLERYGDEYFSRSQHSKDKRKLKVESTNIDESNKTINIINKPKYDWMK